MIRWRATLRGIPDLRQGLQQVPAVLDHELTRAMTESLETVATTAKTRYLSGPYPTFLHPRTGRFRAMLNRGHPDRIFQVLSARETGRPQVRGTLGVQSPIATVFEPPDGRTMTVIRPRVKQYLRVPTNFIKTPAGVVRGPYQVQDARTIPNTFVVRSRSGALSIWQQIHRRTRRRGEGLSVVAQPIFWLVRQVHLRARPFLAPALRDSTPQIQQFFVAALQRVERLLQQRWRR